MSKDEFLRRLDRALAELPTGERQDIVRDYEEHFLEAGASGKREQDTVAALGDPSEIAAQLIAQARNHDVDDSEEGWSKLLGRVWKKVRGDWLDAEPYLLERTIGERGVRRIRIQGVTEDVYITPGSGPDINIRLEGTISLEHSRALALETSIRGEELYIEVRRTKSEGSIWQSVSFIRSLKLSLAVPPSLSADYQIQLTTGDIQLSELTSHSIRVKTTTGDVEIRHCQGSADLQIETTTGDTEILGSYGSTKIAATTGDVEVRGDSQELRIDLTTGDIHAQLQNLPRYTKLDTTTGDIKVQVVESPSYGSLDLSATTGSLTAKLPGSGLRREKRHLHHSFTAGSDAEQVQNDCTCRAHCTTGDIDFKISNC